MRFAIPNSLRSIGPSSRWYIVAFATPIVLFALTGIYVRRTARRMDEPVGDMVFNSGPSIARLSAARSDLRDIVVQIHLVTAALPGNRRDAIAALDRGRAHLAADIESYSMIHLNEHERPQWEQLRRSVNAFQTVVQAFSDRAFDLVPSTDLAERTSAIERDAEEIASMMLRLTEFSAERAQRDAAMIEKAREKTGETALILNGVCVALAALVGALALRSARRYEKLLREAKRGAEARAEELGQFAGRVAHDIRSPLNTVSLSLHTIQRHATGNDKLTEVTARAGRGLARVIRVVETLLAFASSGAQPTVSDRADVRKVLDDVLEEISTAARESETRLEIEAFDRCEVHCGAGVLTIILANLLGNAIKYITASKSRTIAIRVSVLDACVRVEIEDTGPGVPEEMRAAIFEPYVRGAHLAQPGMGLGLATVRRICDAHGGSVGFNPGSQGGSEFWFQLPRARSHAQPTLASSASS